MEAPLGRGGQKPYKEIFESRLTISGIWVWTAPIILWHSNPARTLAWIIPERSQASRTPRSAILRFAILAISHFSAQKWTWVVYFPGEHAHKTFFLFSFDVFTPPKIFLLIRKWVNAAHLERLRPSRASYILYMPYLSSTHLPGTLVFLLPARKSP